MNWENMYLEGGFTGELEWPAMGTMPHSVSLPLRQLLAARTNYCYFAVWQGWGSQYRTIVPKTASIDTDKDQIRAYDFFTGPVAMLDFPFFTGNDHQTANEFWALDYSWWVVTDIDFLSTYIGGDSQLIESILDCEELEVWPVNADGDISINSDRINPKPRRSIYDGPD